MNIPLTAKSNLSQLIVVDMQIRLAEAMIAEEMQKVVRNTGILIQVATLLDVSTLYTEQYPKGLGTTLAELTPLLSKTSSIEKISFSCCDEPKFNRQLTGDKPQIILAGMEAHICILQTALGLHQQGKQVFVAEDAIISRDPSHKRNALERLKQTGVIVSNTESIVFEWLRAAEGDAFKQISRLVR